MRSRARSKPAFRQVGRDRGKSPTHLVGVEMPEAQKDRALPFARPRARCCARRHRAARDRRRDDIVAMNGSAARIDELRAFSAQRFGQEKSRRLLHVEHRRMKLDELHVGDARAGTDTRARRRRRSPRPDSWSAANTWPAPPVASSVARAEARPCSPRLVDKAHADAAAVSRMALDGKRVLQHRDRARLDVARSHSTRPISRPVASPACSTRRTLCAPSDASASRPRRSRDRSARPTR